MGLVEEVGELSHALLKQKQGIRGSADDHEAAAKDAVGDIVIFLANLCSARGWDMDQIVIDTLAEVVGRDWKRYPDSGKPLDGAK
jgi:NTP pyrophosphatase (non-canonical NTP hydrolase)